MMEQDFDVYQKARGMAERELGSKAVYCEIQYTIIGVMCAAIGITIYEAIQFSSWENPPDSVLASIIVCALGGGAGYWMGRDKTNEYLRLTKQFERKLSSQRNHNR